MENHIEDAKRLPKIDEDEKHAHDDRSNGKEFP